MYLKYLFESFLNSLDDLEEPIEDIDVVLQTLENRVEEGVLCL